MKAEGAPTGGVASTTGRQKKARRKRSDGNTKWDASAAVDFLKLHYKGLGGYAQVLSLAPDVEASPTSLSKRIEDIDKLGELIERCNGKENLWFSVNPLKKSLPTKARKKGIVDEIKRLHCDIDCYDNKDQARLAIEQLPKQPTFIIDTGNGLSIFYHLREPISKDKAEQLNKALVSRFANVGADKGTWSVDRLMRIPGTTNLPNQKKREKGITEPSEACLLEHDPTRVYSAKADFKWLQLNGDATQQQNTEHTLPERFVKELETDDKLRRRWEGNTDGLTDKTRSGMDMSLSRLLEARGYSREERYGILQLFPHGKAKEERRQYVDRMADDEDAPIKERIARLRQAKASAHHKQALISSIIVEDLKKNGFFLRTEIDLYYFSNNLARLLTIESPDKDIDQRAWINEWYGINGSESLYRYLHKELEREARVHGAETVVHTFAFYDKEAHKHYLYAGTGKILVTDKNGTTEHTNGHEGILFLNEDMDRDPITIGKPAKALTTLVRFPNFCTTNQLHPGAARKLLRIYIVSLLFPDLLKTRPLLLLNGPKGSSKTSALRALLRVLLGKSVDVLAVNTTKESRKDVEATLTKRHIAVLDNVDGHIHWLKDLLATAATGATITRRRLYTTNTEVEYPIKAFVAMTSREPDTFTRDDIADRLLIQKVDRRKSFKPEVALLSEIDKLRPAFWAEMLKIIRAVVEALATRKEAEHTSHRLADWAVLALVVGPAIGIKRQTVEQLLDKMDYEKNDFVIENDPLHLLLVQLLEAGNGVVEWTNTKDLYKLLKEYMDADRPEIRSSRSLGKRLANAIDDYEESITIEKRAGNSNTTEYRLTLVNQPEYVPGADEGVEDEPDF